VTLPPGLASLATNPRWTASARAGVTMGIVAVAFFPQLQDRWRPRDCGGIEPHRLVSKGRQLVDIGLALYLIFHHLGWNEIAVAYPDLVQSQAWLDATRWIEFYGTWALFAIAASPIPHHFHGRDPVVGATSVLCAMGKLLKYAAFMHFSRPSGLSGSAPPFPTAASKHSKRPVFTLGSG
jgi:hypothetical protein